MPIEEAIKTYRFAFSPQAAARQMSPPPLALTLADLSQPLASLFERAFAPDGSKPGGRPTPADWVKALDQFRQQLRPCSLYPGHKYFAARPHCVWCELEKQGASDFFITVAAAVAGRTGFNLAAAWNQIAIVGTVSSPALPAPPADGHTPRPLPTGAKVGQVCTALAGVGAIAGLLATLGRTPGAPLIFFTFLILWFILRNTSSYRAEKTNRTKALRELEQRLKEAEAAFHRELNPAARIVQAKFHALEEAKQAYENLPAYHAREKQKLHYARERDQRTHYLERFYLNRGKITGIGPSRLATLASFGIETAADLSRARLEPVPGFGPARIQALLAWRDKHERHFRFDASKGVDPADLAALQKRIDARRRDLETTLTVGAKGLQHAKRRYNAAYRTLTLQIAALHDRVAQARVDASVTR